jgi:glycerol-3-phosphate dehydrogenase
MSRSGLSDERTQIGVIGGGAWGTALGIHCARMGHKVLLWAREPEVSLMCQHVSASPGQFLLATLVQPAAVL